MASKVKIALIQMRAEETAEENLHKACERVEAAAAKGAQIICLQELFLSKYFPQEEDANNFALAESIPGATTQKLSELAKQKKAVIIAPIFEKRAAGVYHNSAAVIDADGKLLGTYRKMHIPDDPCFYEKFYFAPGDLGFRSFATKYAKIGVLICWDQWYPEAARLTALSGAQILFYPTAIGWHKNEDKRTARTQLQAWQTIQRSHAIANGVFVAAANRIGVEEELTFWGNSFVAEPSGEVVASAGKNKEEILIADCNLSKIEAWRHAWPFLRDRRVDAYSRLAERYIED